MSALKFEHAPGGVIHYQKPSSALGYLFTIGALALTSKQSSVGVDCREYATDRSGLHHAFNMAGDALDSLHSAVTALGLLLARVDRLDGKDDLLQVGRLIAGLSDLASAVESEKFRMRESLNRNHSRI